MIPERGGATHFLNFFRARWCASRPSERDLRALTSTWLRPPPPPYQRTQTVMVPGGPKDSTLPGQAGLPLAAPHTSSPTSSFLWLFSSDFASVTKGFWNNSRCFSFGFSIVLFFSLHAFLFSLSLYFTLPLLATRRWYVFRSSAVNRWWNQTCIRESRTSIGGSWDFLLSSEEFVLS